MKKLIFVLLLGVAVIFAGCKSENNSIDYDWRECYAVAFISKEYSSVFRITDEYSTTLGSPDNYYKQIFAKQKDGMFYLKVITWADETKIYEEKCGQKCIVVNFME